MNELDKLTELTDNLPQIEDSFVKLEESNSLFKAENGTILGWKLSRIGLGFAVHKWFISKGTSMGIHHHTNSIESQDETEGTVLQLTLLNNYKGF